MLLAALLMSACANSSQDSTSRDESGAITEGGDIGVFALQVGDCVDDPAMLATKSESFEVAQLVAVPCQQSHTGEVVAVDQEFFAGADAYPGEEAVGNRATDACVTSLEEYTGQKYADSPYDFIVLYPTKASWKSADDRGIACIGIVLGDDGSTPVESTGSMRAPA